MGRKLKDSVPLSFDLFEGRLTARALGLIVMCGERKIYMFGCGNGGCIWIIVIIILIACGGGSWGGCGCGGGCGGGCGCGC